MLQHHPCGHVALFSSCVSVGYLEQPSYDFWEDTLRLDYAEEKSDTSTAVISENSAAHVSEVSTDKEVYR